MSREPILIFYSENGVQQLKMEYVSDDTIAETMNGESGYHIYHVRMMTEFLLRELCASKSEYEISEDDIIAMSVASSLHDIGKIQIPQSILNHPGALSPVEYDIVKKHSLFGEKMIREARSDGIDAKIMDYAAQIAKSHHERVDGTGYPEGLHGGEIPLCAQVVALADSYDALTSPRSYKDAFSQDVALQMIASGMCGVFDEALVACLMKVVNHRSLVAFREKVLKKRSVVEEFAGIHPKRVLCIGNTEYLTEAFVKDTFPRSKVMVVGNTELGNADKIKLFRVRKPSVKAILETYEFDLIVFFSVGLCFHTTAPNDAESLREVLQYVAKLQPKSKILYFSSLDTAFQNKTDKAILASANENLCAFYAKHHGLDIKIVQIPYLYSGTYRNDFFYSLFDAVYNRKTVKIPESASGTMHFLSLYDLSDLILRIVDNWTSGRGILSVGDEFHLTFSDLAKELSELGQDVKVEFSETPSSGKLKTTNTALRNEYGWFAKISVLADLPEQYAHYLATKQERKQSRMDTVKHWITEHSLFVKIVELILLFLASELLIHWTDSAVFFSIVDFRTIFIVVMATLYGLSFGVASAALSSVSYFVARVMAGTDPLTIFYEPTNWLAFVFFFLVGGLCGYVSLKKEDHGRVLEEQNKLLENKLIFTGELYEDTLREKKQLKKQIISSKDSFGKIFDITRKLNTVLPQQLYLRIIETFEEILENKSITVYSVRPGISFGRLEVASRDLLDVASRSVSLDVFSPVIDQLKNGEIWKNTALIGDYPMYAAGVYRGDDLVLIICLWHANFDQRSLYYVNLFKILRDLVQMSLLRAYDYHVALAEKQYVADTHIMNAAYFKECVRNFDALSEKKVSSYMMLEFDLNNHSLEDADAILAGKVRTTDILGLAEDGKLRLLLSQATEKDLAYILPRFESLDLTVTVCRTDASSVV